MVKGNKTLGRRGCPVLSKRAQRMLERIRAGKWYPVHTFNADAAGPTIRELWDAGEIMVGGRVAVVRACYVPRGTKPYKLEQFPKRR